MDLVIEPEPDAEQREAVELALTKLFGRVEAGQAFRSAWWTAGVSENFEGGAFEDGFD
jgi:hypothetical protein